MKVAMLAVDEALATTPGHADSMVITQQPSVVDASSPHGLAAPSLTGTPPPTAALLRASLGTGTAASLPLAQPSPATMDETQVGGSSAASLPGPASGRGSVKLRGSVNARLIMQIHDELLFEVQAAWVLHNSAMV